MVLIRIVRILVSVFSVESWGGEPVSYPLCLHAAFVFQYSLWNLGVVNPIATHTVSPGSHRFQYSLWNLGVVNRR